MSNFWLDGGFGWLGELCSAEAEHLRRVAPAHLYARGEIIFEPVARPRSVFLLGKGLVRIYRLSAEGGEATLGYVPAGEVFGELEAFSDGPRESFAKAVRPSLVWQVPLEALQRLLDAHPRMARSIAEQIGSRLKRMERRFENLALHDLRTRIGLVLLELGEDFGLAGSEGLCIDVPLSQLDVGTLVGATRQSVNACLRELRDARLVVHRNGRFVVPDPAALRRMLSA